jgi:DNA-binding MarR family transcriptional regulator
MGLNASFKRRRENIVKNVLEDRDYNLWVLLSQVRVAIMRTRATELSKYGMSTMQAGVLFAIKAVGEEATPTKISRVLLKVPHAVGAILMRMEKQGLIKRVRDLQRKNLVRAVLTEKGEEAFEQSIRREPVHEIFSSLSEEERRQLKTILLKLLDNALDRIEIDPRPLRELLSKMGMDRV